MDLRHRVAVVVISVASGHNLTMWVLDGVLLGRGAPRVVEDRSGDDRCGGFPGSCRGAARRQQGTEQQSGCEDASGHDGSFPWR